MLLFFIVWLIETLTVSAFFLHQITVSVVLFNHILSTLVSAFELTFNFLEITSLQMFYCFIVWEAFALLINNLVSILILNFIFTVLTLFVLAVESALRKIVLCIRIQLLVRSISALNRASILIRKPLRQTISTKCSLTLITFLWVLQNL